MVIGRSVVTGFLNGSVLLYLLSGTISSVFRVWDYRRISSTEKEKKKRRFIRFRDILTFLRSIFFHVGFQRTPYLMDASMFIKYTLSRLFDNVTRQTVPSSIH